MIRNLILAAALISTLALVQCSADRTSTSEPVVAESPIPVKIETVSQTTAADGFEATGTVSSKTVTPISAKVMGYVESVEVREGDRVQAGQLLVSIDSRDARARVTQAEAGLAEAKSALEEVNRSIDAAQSARDAAAANAKLADSTFQRYAELLKRNSVSKQEYDEVSARKQSAEAQLRQSEEMLQSAKAKKGQVESKIEQAQAALEQARLYLGYCRVQAPFAGVISDKQVDLGQLASPGVPMLTLEDAKNFEMHAIVPESRIDQVAVGQAVDVSVDSLGRTLSGSVVDIVPRSDPASRSVMVKIRLPYSPGLHSGLYATAQLHGGGETILSVPASALIYRGQLVGLYKVDESNHATFRLVKPGRELGDRVEVLSGISPGDRVVVEPSDSLKDGSSLEISANRNLLPAGDSNSTKSQRQTTTLQSENC
jgi:multidrug efflux pump subunit AcrA (membrane-fusion protein)